MFKQGTSSHARLVLVGAIIVAVLLFTGCAALLGESTPAGASSDAQSKDVLDKSVAQTSSSKSEAQAIEAAEYPKLLPPPNS